LTQNQDIITSWELRVLRVGQEFAWELKGPESASGSRKTWKYKQESKDLKMQAGVYMKVQDLGSRVKICMGLKVSKIIVESPHMNPRFRD